MNVTNTTDATTGATTLLLAAQQNTLRIHTPFTTPYETRSNRHDVYISVIERRRALPDADTRAAGRAGGGGARRMAAITDVVGCAPPETR